LMIVCNKKSPAPIDTEHSSLTTNPSLWPAKRSKAERRNAGYTLIHVQALQCWAILTPSGKCKK